MMNKYLYTKFKYLRHSINAIRNLACSLLLIASPFKAQSRARILRGFVQTLARYFPCI